MSKIYMPNELINNNYNYEYTSDYIVVHKYTNRYQDNWGNWYSDCVRVFPNFDYNISNVYSCNESFTTYLNKNDLSSDITYRLDYVNILIIFFILAIIIYVIPFKLVSRLFGRWFKL